MNKYKVSVIVPVYNVEKYISKCIESLRNQTYSKIEVIIVNDGSTDNSKDICDFYKEKDVRIRVLHKTNEGVSAARNDGIELATGEYIMFVDGDDWIDENTVEKCIEILEVKDHDLLMWGVTQYIYDRSDKYIQSINRSIVSGDFYGISKISTIMPYLIKEEKLNSPWGKIYRTSIIKQNKIRFNKELEIAEDLLFNIDYIAKCESLKLIPTLLYNYRNILESNSLSKKFRENQYEYLNYVNDVLLTTMKKITYNDEIVMNTCYFMHIKNLYSCFIGLYNNNCHLDKKEKIKYIEQKLNSNKTRWVLNNITTRSYKENILIYILKVNNKYFIYFTCKLLNKLKKMKVKWIK